jgi:hypothetical protein
MMEALRQAIPRSYNGASPDPHRMSPDSQRMSDAPMEAPARVDDGCLARARDGQTEASIAAQGIQYRCRNGPGRGARSVHEVHSKRCAIPFGADRARHGGRHQHS